MRNSANILKKGWSNFKIQRLTEANVLETQALVTNHYSPGDETRKALGICSEKAIQLDRLKAKQFVQNGLSIGIFEKDFCRLVGAALNKLEVQSDYRQGVSIINDDPNNKWKKPIVDVLQKLMGGNIFSELRVQKILMGRILVIDSAYARLGLASLLTEVFINLAKELECDVVLVYITSNASANLARKSGFKIIRSIDLLQYVDEATGQKPFVNAKPPHNMVHLCYYRAWLCWMAVDGVDSYSWYRIAAAFALRR
ncbi:uncharacterized protein LOC144747764 [Ciona intestinalis]